jgi:methylated-DNA-[protein]-cysteine S-methyltransferase
LVEVKLPPLGDRPAGEDRDTADVDPKDLALLKRWVEELESYFRGERLSWKAEELDLPGWSLNGFTRTVYETLLGVPAGLTVSYGMLAQMAGFPRAARAVGTAMATNPIPIVVPCHRVIRSDGSLGRYGNDPKWKERLLAHERRYVGQGGR